jgi:hypothetical protein
MGAFPEQLRRLVVQLTHSFDLFAKGCGVIRVRIQPIPIAMGLKLSLLLKNAQHCEGKYFRQSPVPCLSALAVID